MPILSLCTGVGALDSAVEALTGEETTHCAEKDEAASAVLAYRFPGIKNLGDVTEVDWATFAANHPEINVIAAGFSCQDISNAGPRGGIGGSRSRVWKNVAEAVGHVRPGLVFLENVAAIRSRGLNVVAEDLAAVGYDLRWTCVRASEVEAAHQRFRWFGLAVPCVSDAPGVGRPERWAESAEQPGRLRRSAGDGGEPAADAGGPGLEVRSVEPARAEQSPAERGGPATEDADGEPRVERVIAAPRQAQEGGAWPHAR